MKTPPFLLGLALLFWGWRIDALWLAVPMALAAEAGHWVRVRYEFPQHDLDRIWNLCVLLFVASAVTAFALSDGFDAIGGMIANNSPGRRLEVFNKGASTAIQFLQYSPATLLPILLAQTFAQQERFPWSTFSGLLRRRRPRRRRGNEADLGSHPIPPRDLEGDSLGSRNPTGHGSGKAWRSDDSPPHQGERGLNVSYPYLGITLYASSLSNGRNAWFFVGLVGLLAWTLFRHRTRAFGMPAWTASFACALSLGVAGSFGLVQLQQVLRDLDNAIMARLGHAKNFDPKGTRTRLGSIGGMKNSSQIVLRAESEGNPPPLLREASYDQFKAPMWFSSKRNFEPTLPDSGDSSWPLVPRAFGSNTLTLSTYLDGGKGVLALPAGAVRLTELPVLLLTNAHGAVQVEEGPGFVRFDVHFQADSSTNVSRDGPPAPDDLRLPPDEESVLREISAELRLVSTQPSAAIEAVRRYFAQQFEYTIWLERAHQARSNRTALAVFLLETRKGHCEYFATATTLLLRAAGIPARYAVGYAVQEKKGRFHLVRERDAHAWALAWVDGRWQDVDTTPGTWAAIESRRASFWEPLYDTFSRVWFEFSKWRWGRSDWKRYVVWLIVPLVAVVALRLLYQKQWRRVRPTTSKVRGQTDRPGLDSELYQLEHRLQALGLERAPDETIAHWLHRAARDQAIRPQTVCTLIDFHYRLRFDPLGLPASDRATLRSIVAEWSSHKPQKPG